MAECAAATSCCRRNKRPLCRSCGDPPAGEQQIPLQKVTAEWPVGTDPVVHIAKIRELFDSGVSNVNIHSGHRDQRQVVEFYGRNGLPKLGLPA
jgi:hypothetical protein